jgi:hypothetical protein
MIFKVTFYDWMSNPKICYCFGSFDQVKTWCDSLPDANNVLIEKQPAMVLVKPTGFITLVDCTE